MNRTFTPLVFAFGTSSLLLMDSAIKGSVILLGAVCGAVLLKRDSAAMRHLVWLVAIVAMLFIPVLSVLLPRWQVLPAWASISQSLPAVETPNRTMELPRPFGAPTSESPEIIVPGDLSSQPKAIDTVHISEALEQPKLEAPQDNVGIDRATSDPSWSWMTVLPFLWSIGFGVLVLRLMAARWLLWSNEKRATVIAVSGCPNDARQSIQHESDAAIASAFESAHRQLGIRQRVQLLIDSERTIPVVWGIFWIRLMLPDSVRQWSSEQLRSVLLHELAHIKRHDTIVQLLAQFACALHWFNPLVWFAAWRLHVERERACDDLVLAQGVRASAYAEHLLNVATKLTVARWASACGLAMASHSPLESRLRAILSDRLNRRKVSTAIGMIGLLLGAAIAIPIAMLRAAADDWNPPSGAHVGSNEFSAYCVHDGKNAAFVIAYQGFTGSSSAHDSNSKTRTWTDSGTFTAKKPGIALSFHRTHIAPDKLSITTAPSEAQDLSKPAPPRRDFGQKGYDLNKGRVFLLSDNGSVRQLNIATPIVTDQESLQQLAALIPATTEKGAFTAWGKEVGGLQAGLGFKAGEKRAYSHGETVDLVLRVRNVGKEMIKFSYFRDEFYENPPIATDGVGKSVHIEGAGLDGEPNRIELNLAPGKEVDLSEINLGLRPASEKGKQKPAWKLFGTGKFQLQCERVAGNFEDRVNGGPDPILSKLATGKLELEIKPAAAPAPMHKDAKALFEEWQRYARANGDIPGALVGELAAAVKQFIKYNPTWETVPKLNAILPRLDATRDWNPADAIALLDEVAGIQHTLLEPAPWKGTRNTIRHGDALPTKYADVAWGEEQPNGLRAAWLLEPSETEHRIGTALKARLLVQNRGQVPVMLQVPTWHQGWVKGTDAKGSEVQVSGIEWTTMAFLNTVRLGPGAYVEINTPGVGLGPRAGMGPWAGPRVGSNVLAKPGDELTLTYSLVPLDGSEVGISEEDPHVSGPLWWLAHIKMRLNRELPLPTDAAERTRLLDRAVRELFATAPTAEETEAFIADKTPNAIDALAKRLAARTDVVSFSGKLPTSPVKFRVLDANANADEQPRVVLGPGEYPLSAGTAKSGAAKLKIVDKRGGERRTNEAQILFEATEATGKLPPDAHKFDVPDGWGTWAIVCRPNEGFFYLLSKGTVRKIDYTDPAKVTDNPANDLPAEFRDEVKRQLDIHEISEEQQAKIFEKPAAPAASLRVDEQEKSKVSASESQPMTTEQKGEPDTTAQPDWVLAWDFRITPLEQQYSKMRISKDGMLETILRKPPLLRTQLSSQELSKLIALVANNPQAKSQPMSKLAMYSNAISPTPELFEALKKVPVRSEIIAVVHEGKLFELDLNTAEAMDVDVQLKKFVGLAAIGGSEKLSRFVELANRELMRKYPNLSTPIDPTDFYDGEVDHPSGKLSVWFNYSINPESTDGQMVLLRISENGQPSIEPVILPRIVTLDELEETGWKLPNANANIVKVPDDQYVKSGVPVDELAGEGVMWNDAQNGLSLGYRIMGDEWRILGKEVKVELWVQNHGDREVKFQDNMRADPEFGLRVKLKDAKGEDHNSNFWPDDRPPFGFHRLLPPGHAFKVKEFTISLFLPENDFSHAKGHFLGINPGAYNFHCELELPGFSATGEGGKQLTPAAGEWTGKLTTRGLNVEVIAPDAPAQKPRIESLVVGISKDGEISFDRKKMPLDELKTLAARNAKKWFTIQTDEDVPYAKVIAVIEALKASGVTQFSFAKARVGDGKYRVANRTGSYEFDETRRFSICQPFERKQWFTVAWPAKDGQRAKSLKLYPNASEQTRGTWAVVWEPGTDVLWWVDDTDIGKMTLTDPARVIVDRKGRTTSFSRDFAVPDGVATEFRRLGFDVGGKPGDRLVIGGPTSKQEILSAEPVQN